MSKETLVCIFGFLIFMSPFIGVPREYKEWFLMGIGIVLIIIGYRLRHHMFLRSLEDETGERRTDMFVESITTTNEMTSQE